MLIQQKILRGGVVAYLDAVKAEYKAINSFKRACTQLATARNRKYNALQIVLSEYAFLTDKEVIKPGLADGHGVVIQKLVDIVEQLDSDMYADVASLFIDDKKQDAF